MSKLLDFNRRIGGDVLNLSGSDEDDLVAQRLGLAPPSLQSRGVGPTFTSGESSIDEFGVTIDPAIAARKERGMGMVGGSLSGLQQSRQSAIGSRQDFMKGRTDPLKQSSLNQRANLEERQTKTGVSGEFGRQTVESFDVSTQQALDQSEAGAFNEFESLSQSFDQSEGGLLKLQEAISKADFAQQAQARGMSRDLLSQLVDIHLTEQGIRTEKATARGEMTGAGLSIIGKFFSSRTFKYDKQPLDNQHILNSMMKLDVEKWKYNGEEIEHIGCYAEDFNEKFGVKGEKTISVVDIVGVLMASIQAQQEQINELKEKG